MTIFKSLQRKLIFLQSRLFSMKANRKLTHVCAKVSFADSKSLDIFHSFSLTNTSSSSRATTCLLLLQHWILHWVNICVFLLGRKRFRKMLIMLFIVIWISLLIRVFCFDTMKIHARLIEPVILKLFWLLKKEKALHPWAETFPNTAWKSLKQIKESKQSHFPLKFSQWIQMKKVLQT